jgi:uncharacterized protein (DUF58 family)
VILPSTRLIWVAAILSGAGVGASLSASQASWFAVAALVLVISLGDALAALRLPSLPALRRVPASLAVGVRTEVLLRIANPERRALRLELHDHHPASFEAEGLPRRLAVAPSQWVEMRYPVRPVTRGEARFERAELRIFSPLGLWQAKRRSAEEQAVRVYPNFRALAKYTLLATDNRLSQIGVLQVRRRGEGTEFHQLREYRQGDPQRALDWKATARTARLIAREYQEEKDQRVLLVIDCGRRMASKDDDLSHFDHTLNAALLLAHVALRQGDAVGMLTMGGVHRYLEPRKSIGAVHTMLNRVYDLEPTLAVPDYDQAARDVMRHVRRRALVILLTNLRDEDDENLLPALRLLRTCCARATSWCWRRCARRSSAARCLPALTASIAPLPMRRPPSTSACASAFSGASRPPVSSRWMSNPSGCPSRW